MLPEHHLWRSNGPRSVLIAPKVQECLVLCQAAQGTRFCVVDPGCLQEIVGKPKKKFAKYHATLHNKVVRQHATTITVDTSTASFVNLPVLQRETFSVEVRSIWKWVLLRSGRTAYSTFPGISLQNSFAHVHFEVLTQNTPYGGIHEIDPRLSLRPTALFECGSPLRPE